MVFLRMVNNIQELDDEEKYSTSDIAKIIGVHTTTVARHCNKGSLKGLRNNYGYYWIKGKDAKVWYEEYKDKLKSGRPPI